MGHSTWEVEEVHGMRYLSLYDDHFIISKEAIAQPVHPATFTSETKFFSLSCFVRAWATEGSTILELGAHRHEYENIHLAFKTVAERDDAFNKLHAILGQEVRQKVYKQSRWTEGLKSAWFLLPAAMFFLLAFVDDPSEFRTKSGDRGSEVFAKLLAFVATSLLGSRILYALGFFCLVAFIVSYTYLVHRTPSDRPPRRCMWR